MAEATITRVNTRRPPYWSVQIPRKIRLIEPVRTGVATRRPNWVSDNPKSCFILTPMIEKIVQTAKQNTKATVLIPSIWFCLLVSDVVVMFMIHPSMIIQNYNRKSSKELSYHYSKFFFQFNTDLFIISYYIKKLP